LDTPRGVLLQFVAFAALAAGVVGLAAKSWRQDLYASPSACLRTYIRAVLAVNEEAELDTATAKLRAKAERERGPDKAKRKKVLAGKTALFEATPIHWTREDVTVWGERARIVAVQGTNAGRPRLYTYSFLYEKEKWKIDNIEYGREQDFK
jgi:hypothetical protein